MSRGSLGGRGLGLMGGRWIGRRSCFLELISFRFVGWGVFFELGLFLAFSLRLGFWDKGQVFYSGRPCRLAWMADCD